MLYKQNMILGATLIVLSEFMFASMGALVKTVSTNLPNEMVVFMRNLMGLLVLIPLLLHGGLDKLRTNVFHLHLLRAMMGLSAMYCFFYALANLPLADSMLLKMTAPIFMPIIAFVWLREHATKLAMVAVPIGFAGVVLVLNPTGDINWIALVALMGGLFAAIAKVTVRRLGRSEPTVRIVFYFSILALLVSALPLFWKWQMPLEDEWALLVMMGLAGTSGQLLLTRAYAVGSTARISPFTYFSVVFAAIYGYIFWGEILDIYFIVGSILVVLAGILALYSKKPLENSAAPVEE